MLLRRRDSREPTLIDLANVVEDEMTLVSNPLYSREAVSQYFEKGPTRQGQRGDRRKLHTMATKTDNSSKVHTSEIKRAMKGPVQYVVKSMILKTASITCNKH